MCDRARERYAADRKRMGNVPRRRRRHAAHAEPDHHRRAQMRDHEHPPLPRPPSGDPDVEAEGAQLLRPGAELGPRPPLVRGPLRRPLQGPRRVLAPLHQPAQLLGSRRARIRENVPDARLLYMVRDPISRILSHWRHATGAGYETRRDGGRSDPRRPDLRDALDVLDAAAALPRALPPRADPGDRPGGAPGGPRRDDAPRLRVRGRRSELHLGAVRPRVGALHREGVRASTSSWRS